jgi:DNA-binding PadR family transcriptional regulator
MGPPTWAPLGGELHEVALQMPYEKPINGAEVTRAVEEFTWEFWKSFLSSVYPLLLGLGLELIIGYRVARLKNIAVNLTQSLYARR